MSPGGEPGRDDSGLPPVDIEIPDDARELDRDLHAYRREQRAVRRNYRRSRWHRSLIRDGIVLPLLACCLILALITGTLLTVFTATSEQGLTGPPGSGTNSGLTTGPGSGAVPGEPSPHILAGAQLPRGVIAVDGHSPLRLNSLRHAMLVLVPRGCNCRGTLAWLANVALRADAAGYVIYNNQTSGEVQRLYGELDALQRSALAPAEDAGHVLTRPASIPTSQLTAILVAPDRTVHYATGLSPRDSQDGLVQAIMA